MSDIEQVSGLQVFCELVSPVTEMVCFSGGLMVAMANGEIVFITEEDDGSTLVRSVNIG